MQDALPQQNINQSPELLDLARGGLRAKHCTHRVAISNYRVQSVDDKTATFSYKDYQDKDRRRKNDIVCRRIYSPIFNAHSPPALS